MSIAVVTGVVCLIVLFRYILRTDLFGLDEVELLLAFWIYFIGGAFGARYGVQIKADFTGFLLSRYPRLRLGAQILGRAIAVLIGCVFAYWGIDFIVDSYNAGGRTPILMLPVWVARLPVCIGTTMVALYLTIDLLIFVRSRGESGIGETKPTSFLPEYHQ